MRNPSDEKYWYQYKNEYERVRTEFQLLQLQQQSSVRKYDTIGLIVIDTILPMHYYSLFSVSRGVDIVVSLYSNNRFEVEEKYTSYVDINSRGCLPRVGEKGYNYNNK